MTGPLDIISRLYPKARITSGYRSPSNPLSRANPSSAHMHGTIDNPGAVDVAPIPGVSFDRYVASLRQAGLPVSGALDEAAHPKPWTTGPNWHVSLLGQSQQMPQRKPMTLASLKQPQSMFPVVGGMDPLAPNPEPYYAQQQQAAPATLADLGQSKFPVANGVDPLAPQKHHSKFNLGNIAGILGDALMAYGGMAPQFGPNLARQQDDERQQGFEREKFNAMLDLQRQKALMPKAPTQTQQFVNEILDPKTPPERRALLRSVLMRPLIATVNGADGSQYQQPYYADQAGGSDDDWEYSN